MATNGLIGMNSNNIDGPNGLPSMISALSITGVGAGQTTIERTASAPAFRLLHVAATGSLTLKDLTLTGGLTPLWGGGIYNTGTLVVMASAVIGNQAASGSGAGLANRGGSVAIEHSIFRENATLHMGGGVLTDGGTVTIGQSTLADNSADGGGGLYMYGGTVMISQTTIVENSASVAFGGGLINYGGTLTLISSTIARNSADGRGVTGGLSTYDGGTTRILNSTIVENALLPYLIHAAGGILVRNGTVELQSTVVARNLDGFGEDFDCGGPVTSRGHNVIGDPTGCTISLQPTDLIGDPGLDAYADDGLPGHGHYAPLADSVLINAGDDTACPPTDQLGNPRVGPCDIGAVEFQSPDRRPPVLALTLNQAAFRPGETLRMAVHLRNPGPILTTDVYVGAIFPDGQTVLWLVNTAPLQGVVSRLDSNPSTFTPMLRNASWPAGLDVTQEGYLSYRFTGGEAPGIYHLLIAWTKPGSLSNGRIDEGDVLALDWKAVQFTGPASTLAAKAQEIRARYATE